MVLSGGVRAGLVVMAVALAACGSPSPSRTPSPTAVPSATTRPSAAAGACASVITTTPIEQVPAACAALWAPYGVTKVPPANLTDATPVTKTVVNATQGAASDADVGQWILASNRDSVWYRWAEANDQPRLLSFLGSPSLNPPAEIKALAGGEAVNQPDCALFPSKVTVFPITAAGSSFFHGLGETVTSSFVFVGRYPGPCAVTASSASGATQTLASYPSDSVTFFAGSVRADPLLGSVLFYDGAGNCSDLNAPTNWCQA